MPDTMMTPVDGAPDMAPAPASAPGPDAALPVDGLVRDDEAGESAYADHRARLAQDRAIEAAERRAEGQRVAGGATAADARPDQAGGAAAPAQAGVIPARGDTGNPAQGNAPLQIRVIPTKPPVAATSEGFVDPSPMWGAYTDQGELVGVGPTPDEAQIMGLRNTAEPGAAGRLARDVGAIAGDVGMGVLETPRQAIGGISDAIQETGRMLESADRALTERFGDLRFDVRMPGQDEDDDLIDISPGALLQAVMPDVPEPRSVTGAAVRGIAQFLTGFAGAGKIFRSLGIAAPATKAGRAADSAVRGAISDFAVFDPHEERLADMIQAFPDLANPITEFMASSEDETEWEARIKRAIEGVGLGLLANGVMLGLRALKSARQARQAVEDQGQQTLDAARQKYGDVLAEDLRQTLGDPDSLDMLLRDPPDISPDAVLRGTPEAEGKVYINWARIDTPEDIKAAAQALADAGQEGIDAARRGVRTNLQTIDAAREADAWGVLTSRRQGQPLNAEESLALRNLWATATDHTVALAEAAAANPSEANMFAFRKILAIQDAVQREVIGARTETARALQSWRIPAGSSIERAREIQAILAGTAESPEVHREIARRIATLGKAGELEKLNEVAQRSVAARTHDAVVQAWINGLLTGPKTHLVNMLSNTSVIGLSMVERATAARLGHVMGTENAVQIGEATAQWFGMIQGLKDALRISSQAERMGTAYRSLITGQTGFGMGKIDLPRQGALASEVWNVASDTTLGRALDAMNVITQIPGRALGAEDELFKTIGYRMELNALALRMANSEVASGAITSDQLKARVADIVANPPEHVRISAVDAATYQTFTNAAGEISGTIMKFRNAVPVLGPLLAPFVRTVGNIMSFTFERTPIAPLMGRVRADIAAGGARRDMAMARIALGSSLMMMSADLAMSGTITGAGVADSRVRAAERRAGIQPYSIKVGDRWYAYNRMDPIGTLLGISADMVDVLANGSMDDQKWAEDMERAMVATVAAIGSNAMSKTYLTGLSDFVEALADPTRNSEYWAQGVVGSFMPTIAAEARRLDDPYMREVRSMWDAVRNRTPGLSEDLPLRRDLWGRPIDYRSGLGAVYDAAMPIYSRVENPEPIDTELMRIGNGPSMPARRMSFEGVTVNLDQYDGAYSRFLELSGNELKLPKYPGPDGQPMGAKDFLNSVVEGTSPFAPIYDMRTDGPDGGKMAYIRGVISDYREAAKAVLSREYPELLMEVTSRKAAMQRLNLQ